ncbi:MAG TPA: elongation factor G [Candidatus Dormibacteraeota bacterium]|nr:elongation factor G [Candidatus Dormibacteraeota bacterium]
MAEAARDRLRSVAILGHSHDGKTTLAESLCFTAGAVARLGSTDQGTALMDFEPEEQRRHISVGLGMATLDWDQHRVTVVDTPGFQDLEGEVRCALRAVDGAILAVAAGSGALAVGTESAWELLQGAGLPRVVVVTKLDKEHADFEATLAALRQRLTPRPVAVHLPIGEEHDFRGVVDLVSGAALGFDARGGAAPVECPGELDGARERLRQELIEAVAETDDALLERYLEGTEPSPAELAQAIAAGTRAGTLVPVLAAAPVRGFGAAAVLDAVVRCLPPPDRLLAAGADGEPPPASDSGHAPVVFVFKTTADPFGKISYFRVMDGTVRADAHLHNQRTGLDERLVRPARPKGKALEPADALGPGEIGAVTKLLHTETGDTLGPKDATTALPAIDLPPTGYTMAVRPKTKGDEEKIHAGLARLLEEDPTLRSERDPVTHETLLHGLGDVHLDVSVEKLKRKAQVEAVLTTPQIPYQETIRTPARQQHKYKKQSGGAGLYGDCTLEIEPLPRGGGYEWEDKIFGGSIPHQFRPSVEKGVRQALEQGVLAGYPLVDVKVRLVDGSTHPVDGKDIAFQLAGAMAMREAVDKAGPYLLEPIMDVDVVVPEATMGDVIAHLNSRRGRIGGMTSMGAGLQRVTAHAPLAEMYRFPIELRAATQGRGRYTMRFAHYEEVPAAAAQAIVAARKEVLHAREPGGA